MKRKIGDEVLNGTSLDRNEKNIRRCIELSYESLRRGDWPFGAVITDIKGEIVAEGLNTAKQEITGHAEVNAVSAIIRKNSKIDLSTYTLYSNFEPCPMCSFIIREHGIGRVVFSLTSPYWGGSTRWNILTDKIPPNAFHKKINSKPPEIIGGILAPEAAKIFDSIGWTIHKEL